MTFKNHLIAIAVISVVVLVAWNVFQRAKPAEQPVAATNTSPYQIIIVRASWGLNCTERFGSSDKIHENNIHEAIANLCNGQINCSVAISDVVKFFNPLPQCTDKQLEVDYRCFSFDRLRSAKTSSGQLQITCQNIDLAAPQ
jgi:hypothetical protein